MKDIIIRKATFEDAAEIANVHINSWREAYKGLISQDRLDDRHLHFKNRYELWKRVTVDEKQTTLVAESKEHGVVGFVNDLKTRKQAFACSHPPIETSGDVTSQYRFLSKFKSRVKPKNPVKARFSKIKLNDFNKLQTYWCPRRESNPHTIKVLDPKSSASANSATRAFKKHK